MKNMEYLRSRWNYEKGTKEQGKIRSRSMKIGLHNGMDTKFNIPFFVVSLYPLQHVYLSSHTLSKHTPNVDTHAFCMSGRTYLRPMIRVELHAVTDQARLSADHDLVMLNNIRATCL
jgi:hypothetical protein